MKMYDISAPIFEGMPVYKKKDEKQPRFETQTNGHVTETRISLDAHTGTHVDAPLHMINSGETIETVDIEKLAGPCKVFDLTEVEGGIRQQDLEGLDIQKGDNIIFKTKNSFDEEFNFEFIFLAEDGARYMAEKGVNVIGTDALGIERSQPEHPTHRTLFENGVIVIEGLRLKDIEPGEYFMVAAPLKMQGIDAAPARVLLFDRGQTL